MMPIMFIQGFWNAHPYSWARWQKIASIRDDFEALHTPSSSYRKLDSKCGSNSRVVVVNNYSIPKVLAGMKWYSAISY